MECEPKKPNITSNIASLNSSLNEVVPNLKTYTNAYESSTRVGKEETIQLCPSGTLTLWLFDLKNITFQKTALRILALQAKSPLGPWT